MNQEVTKNLKCIRLKSGIEIWGDSERLDAFQKSLVRIEKHTFVNFDDETFNTAELEGVFTPSTLADLTRRKNGQWQCSYRNWYDKNEKCVCLSPQQIEIAQRNREIYQKSYGSHAFPLP